MSHVKFALIGCGRVSSRHVDALTNKVPKGKIVAVCDLIPELAEKCSLRLGVPGFTSTEKMYKSVEIDCVTVATVRRPLSADDGGLILRQARGRRKACRLAVRTCG